MPASPGWYRRLLNAAYARLKRVDPGNRVIAAGTAPYGDPAAVGNRMTPVLFLRELLCLQGPALRRTRCGSAAEARRHRPPPVRHRLPDAPALLPGERGDPRPRQADQDPARRAPGGHGAARRREVPVDHRAVVGQQPAGPRRRARGPARGVGAGRLLLALAAGSDGDLLVPPARPAAGPGYDETYQSGLYTSTARPRRRPPRSASRWSRAQPHAPAGLGSGAGRRPPGP